MKYALRHPLPYVILILVLSFSLWGIRNNEKQLCKAILTLTETAKFAPTTDPERAAAEKVINDRYASARRILLDGNC